ncbi:cytochrome c oxidase assembly protein [Paenibacillus beijingensis]|uniref:cytochrome c oxidase assembly protein n=1 Tax=Paenibacillus beijingensis TaxID=1126833 RepID=UPI0030838515
MPQLILSLPFVMVLIAYLVAVVTSNRRNKLCPMYRTAFWVTGVFCAVAAVAGPLADRARMDFTTHMLGHLFLGMAAPLLMVLAAPVTLILRSLNVSSARRFSLFLRSWPIRIISDPIVASTLNVGGLWVLYTTNLYTAMQQNMLLHMAVQIHVFFAGYLFTVSMISIDPTPHRTSFVYRAVVLVTALAGHGILSKTIYAKPPACVPAAEAETGGMLMYYGGDAIELLFIFILCLQWFIATRPRAKVDRG